MECHKNFILIIVVAAIFPSASFAESSIDLQRELLRNNPQILAAKNRYLAAAKVPIQEGTLPDPMVSVTDFGVGHPLSGLNESDFAYRSVGVSQELPFPGKLHLRSKITDKQALVAEQDLRWRVVQLLSEFKIQFAEYSYLQKAISIIEKYRGLLTQFAEISETRYRVGEGLQQDVLRAQLERSAIEERLQLLHQELESKRAVLNGLLNRDVNAPLDVDQELTPPAWNMSLENLQQRLQKRSPELLSKIAEEERSVLKLDLAKKERYPDFAISFQWQRTGSNFPDYYMTMFEARIPLYYWRKQKPAIAQATLELQASKNEKEATLKKLQADLKETYIAASTTANLIKLYQEGIIPQSRLSLESALSAYQVGKIDFLTLLNNGTTLLNYESEFIRRIADHYKAITRIEGITGELLAPEGIELAMEELGL